MTSLHTLLPIKTRGLPKIPKYSLQDYKLLYVTVNPTQLGQYSSVCSDFFNIRPQLAMKNCQIRNKLSEN